MIARSYAAEYVFPGHPDKLCDAIADGLVQEAAKLESRALVGVEVAVHRDQVFITGRMACRDAEQIDVESIVRDVYQSAGYDRAWPPSFQEVKVRTDLCLGPLEEGEAEFRSWADDQSIVTGYATNLAGTNFLPPEHWLAWKLSTRLKSLRLERPDLELGPDGKVIVYVEDDGDRLRLATMSTSLQQQLEGDGIELRRAVIAAVEETLAGIAEDRAIPGFDPTMPKAVTINGAGNFALGGPHGDNGLSGKKLVIDAYGPRVPIGGGAMSGKDFFKVDRAGAIAARRLAKAVVVTGVAQSCLATLCFQPGAESPQVVSLHDACGVPLDPQRWSELFDLSLDAMGTRYTGSASLIDVARYGHFTDPQLPWEQLSFDPQKRVEASTAIGPPLCLQR